MTRKKTEPASGTVAQTGPDFRYEERHWSSGVEIVAGIDEAGRGPLAGPVVAAAVVLPAGFVPGELNDSKKLSKKRREKLYEEIMSAPDVQKSVGIVEAEEIDELNILRATHRAMEKAVRGLPVVPGICLIDGLPVRHFPFPQEAIVKGDAKSVSISAASIVAKVTRDRIMEELAKQYPQYGFDRHSGYGTREHLEALKKYGPCPIHRRSFAPVAETSLPLFPEL